MLFLTLLACGATKVPFDTATDTADSSATDSGDSSVIDTGDTSSGDSGESGGDRYHPDDYSSSSIHGIDAKFQRDACLDCHGEDLSGGTSGVSCDSCHPTGWREDCTFCHGRTDDNTGAPPEDIDDQDTSLSFPGHGAHVNATIHAAWSCDQCHVRPTDALSPGHFLVADGTPGVAEVTLAAGLSPDGSYTGSCSNLYCHGDGRTNSGTIAVDAVVSCGDCHPGPSSGSWSSMSGEHDRHVGDGVACGECHSSTVDESGTVTGLDQHVDGDPDFVFPSGMFDIAGTCNGYCHDQIHALRTWE